MILPTIIANLATTGCALLLLRRGPSRRLRLLTLTVGLMSLAQTAACLHSQGIWSGSSAYIEQAHQSLVACLSLVSIYLLGVEIFDRNFTDRKLRLLEHDQLPARGVVESQQTALMVINEPETVGIHTQQLATAVAACTSAMTRFYASPTRRIVDTSVIQPCTEDILALAFTLGQSVRPIVDEQDQAVVDLAEKSRLA